MTKSKKVENLLVRTIPPSSTLEGGFIPAEHQIEPRIDLIGIPSLVRMTESNPFPYRLAKLSDANGDLQKRWRIIFYVWDTKTNQLTKKQKWIPAKFKTKPQRTSEANRLIRAINQLLAKGYHLGTTPSAKQIKPVLWTWIHAFDWVYEHREASIRKRSQQTLELVRVQLIHWLKSQDLEFITLKAATPDLCDDFMQYLRRSRKIGNTTYNNYLGFLKLNFNYLVQHQKLDFSPAKRLRPLATEEPENVNFPPGVKKLLLETYPANIRVMAQYIYYSFIRPGELRKLRVKHIKEKTIYIPGSISKNRKSAHVLISPALEKLLTELNVRSKPSEYFLISADGTPGAAQVAVNFYTRTHLAHRIRLGLAPQYTLYCWKHTGVTDTYQHTLDIEFVSRQCRHSSLDMTKRYLRGLGALQEYSAMDALPDLGL